MRVAKLAWAAGTSAFLVSGLASGLAGQGTPRQRAPIIRIYSENGSYVLETTKYVSPAIQVSENAYVFAVAMDLSGVIQVLHPDFPGISVRMLAHRELRLPNFFAGFTQPSPGDPAYSSVGYSGYDGYDSGYEDSRGTVIALASRAPFNFELIEAGGDWNISKIRQLIENRSPRMAAQALAAYLGAKGEPIGRDYLRFAGARNYYYANNAYNAYNSYSPYDYSYYGCDSYFGYGFAPLRQAQIFSQFNFLRRHGQSARIVGFDLCGIPIVVPAGPFGDGRFPVTLPPRVRGDTTSFPRARFPDRATPRHPTQSAANAAPLGVFPVSRSGLPQIGDVTIKAPRGRRAEPYQVFDGYQSQPGTMSAPQGRIPVDRVMPHTVPAAIGTQPVHEYRPEPRVEAPPPTRVPERPRESPPPTPVVHERPSSPPPPPPRAETPRSEPARVPPPNRR